MVAVSHTIFSTSSSIDNLPEMLSKLLDMKRTNHELVKATIPEMSSAYICMYAI